MIRNSISSVLAGTFLLTFGMAQLSAEEVKFDATKLPAPAAKTGVTYETDIKPLVEKSCLKCHSGQRPKSRYSMETKESVIKGGREYAPAIVPGDSAKSTLLGFSADLVEEYEMPPLDKRDEYPKFTKEELALIRAWIDQGAK